MRRRHALCEVFRPKPQENRRPPDSSGGLPPVETNPAYGSNRRLGLSLQAKSGEHSPLSYKPHNSLDIVNL